MVQERKLKNHAFAAKRYFHRISQVTVSFGSGTSQNSLNTLNINVLIVQKRYNRYKNRNIDHP